MINTIFIRISSIFIVMLLAATVLVAETYLLSYLIKLPPGPALPYYTNPSKYERLNGPPDQVCKFWGDGSKYWNKGHERTECISNLKRTTGKVNVMTAGYTFRAKETKSLVRTNADCIITTDG